MHDMYIYQTSMQLVYNNSLCIFSISSPHNCVYETKLNKSVLDGEISIEHYSCLRKDRNRNGGGFACFIHKSIAFEGLTFLMILKIFSLTFFYQKQNLFCLELPTALPLICNLLKSFQIVYQIQFLLTRKKLSYLETSMLNF